MSELYNYYPEESNPQFVKIKECIINFLIEKCGMNMGKCYKMEFNELYDLFVNKQKEAIFSKSIDEHFVESKKFVKRMLNKEDFDKFRNNFDDFHRFFPEKVFKLASAIAYINYLSKQGLHNPLINEIHNSWKESNYHLDTHLFRLFSHFGENGGNCAFIVYYAYLQAENIMEKYGMRSIIDSYKIASDKTNPNWQKDLNELSKAYNMYSNSNLLTSISPYKKVLDGFDSLQEILESYMFMETVNLENGNKINASSDDNKNEFFTKAAEQFYNAEEKLGKIIEDYNYDIPMTRNLIRDYAKFVSMYKVKGQFKALSLITQEQYNEIIKQSYNIASNYVVTALGGELEDATENYQKYIEDINARANQN